MAGETSSPGEQQDVSFTDKDDESLEVAERALDTDALNPSLYGDFAGSTALANQMRGTITGSKLLDALMPGIGNLSLISSISAQNMQNNLQRGASPVYGPGGTVQGTTSRGLFGGSTVYSGNPDLDPNKSNPNDSNDSVGARRTRTFAGRSGAAVKGVSNTTSARITPSAAVRGSGASLAPKLYAMSGKGKGRGINTSSQRILGSAPVQKKTLLGN